MTSLKRHNRPRYASMEHDSQDVLFLSLAVDESVGLAMCFAMQEQTQNSEESINEEINPEEQAPENDVTPNEDTAKETSEAAKDETPVEEIDPWEALELEAAKWKDQAVRSAAELDNFRKRMSREKLDAVRYGNQSLLEELIPVLDNFNMGMQAASQEEGSMLFIGMKMVQTQISEFFSSQNVEEVPAEANSDFDPNQHDAIGQEASDDVEEGKIIRVMRKGYRIGDRLLRPSNVIVALGDEASSETESK